EAGRDEELDLPREVPGTDRAAAEVRAGRDPHAGTLRGCDGRVRAFLALRDALPALLGGELLDGRRGAERLPRGEHRERRGQGHVVLLHRAGEVIVELHPCSIESTPAAAATRAP